MCDANLARMLSKILAVVAEDEDTEQGDGEVESDFEKNRRLIMEGKRSGVIPEIPPAGHFALGPPTGNPFG